MNSKLKIRLIAIYAVVALFLGVTSTGWMLGMIGQWAIPWSSLAILKAQ